MGTHLVYELEVEGVGAPVDNDCVAHARFSRWLDKRAPDDDQDWVENARDEYCKYDEQCDDKIRNVGD